MNVNALESIITIESATLPLILLALSFFRNRRVSLKQQAASEQQQQHQQLQAEDFISFCV